MTPDDAGIPERFEHRRDALPKGAERDRLSRVLEACQGGHAGVGKALPIAEQSTAERETAHEHPDANAVLENEDEGAIDLESLDLSPILDPPTDDLIDP